MTATAKQKQQAVEGFRQKLRRHLRDPRLTDLEMSEAAARRMLRGADRVLADVKRELDKPDYPDRSTGETEADTEPPAGELILPYSRTSDGYLIR